MTRKRRILAHILIAHFIPVTMSLAVPAVASNLANSPPFACPQESLTACPSSIPFCCPKSTTCTPLTHHGTSVICCPVGANCSLIETISCNVTLQDFGKFPDQLLHTSRLNDKLPRCGTECCPFGYICRNGSCAMKNATASHHSKTSQASHSDQHTAGPTSTKSPTPLILPSHMSSGTASPSSGYPTKSVVLGLFMGLIGGVALMCLGWFLLRRRRAKNEKQRATQTSGKPGSLSGGQAPSCVSDPVVDTQFGYGHRTDFLLRTPENDTGSRISGLDPSPLRHELPSNVTPPRRPARSDEDLTAAEGEDVPKQGVSRQNTDDSYITTGSATPGRTSSTGSTETISVKLMPPPVFQQGGPNGRGVSTNTTFSAMMESAGMKRGQGYLGYPGRWSLSKR